MMKKGRRFSCVCFRGKAENPSQTRNMKDGLSAKDTNRLVTAKEMVKSDLEMECKLSKEKDKEDKRTCDSQLSVLKIQDVWLSLTGCLTSLRCLTLSRHKPHRDISLSEVTQCPDSSDSTNGSPWNTDSSNDGQTDKPIGLVDVPLSPQAEERREEDEEVVQAPPRAPCLGSSYLTGLSSYLSGEASQLFLAQWGRDMMLRMELVDIGGESGDATHTRYRTEWSMSEGDTQVAQGVWLPGVPNRFGVPH
ncbi:uncharacterized protein [Salmo salar]|uniref:Uncharacterized protein n=1 Tax=Salmo salar TaxID=8030 RepID=A0A1S3Q162_SALSA|nr:uncharacterized protein LOC106588793 [Salmo salar]|eukprot:XP_014033694.1 PREDICTED: uncharacterized protein LOC106588793 [Salmo salar]